MLVQVALYALKDFFGIAHLGNIFGADKGRHLNFAGAVIHHLFDVFDLDLRGNVNGMILPAIPGTDLRDHNFFRHAHGDLSLNSWRPLHGSEPAALR